MNRVFSKFNANQLTTFSITMAAYKQLIRVQHQAAEKQQSYATTSTKHVLLFWLQLNLVL